MKIIEFDIVFLSYDEPKKEESLDEELTVDMPA